MDALEKLGQVHYRCDCYVSTMTPEEQFTLRYGAHELACPAYRESMDPVDRAYDREERSAGIRHAKGG
jgi:hypothetical protein